MIHILLAASLSLLSTPLQADASKSIAWANRLLNSAQDLTLGDSSPRFIYDDAANAFKAIIAKYGESKEALIGLASAERGLGEYAASAQTYQRAFALYKDDSALYRQSLSAAQLARLQSNIDETLPKNRHVVHIESLAPGSRRPAYAVLIATTVPRGQFRSEMRDVRLAIYRTFPGPLKQVWESANMVRKGFEDIEWNESNLVIRDLNGDRRPEAIVMSIFYAASAVPTLVEVFELEPGKYRRIANVSSSVPPRIEDLNKDGKTEIVNSYEIGWDMSHAEQPRWTDVYSYKGGNYVVANRDFPAEFKSWPGHLRETLKAHPRDWEIWKYVGITNLILGNKTAARAAQARAVRYCEALVAKEEAEYKKTGDSWQVDVIKHLKSELAELRKTK